MKTLISLIFFIFLFSNSGFAQNKQKSEINKLKDSIAKLNVIINSANNTPSSQTIKPLSTLQTIFASINIDPDTKTLNYTNDTAVTPASVMVLIDEVKARITDPRILEELIIAKGNIKMWYPNTYTDWINKWGYNGKIDFDKNIQSFLKTRDPSTDNYIYTPQEIDMEVQA